MFGKELQEVMQEECGDGDFGTALQLLSVNSLECDCKILNAATHGMGTDELLVYTVLSGRSNREMDLLRKKYFDMYHEDLGQLISSELGGHLGCLAMILLQASEEEYDEGYHTDEKVAQDVVTLHDMGQGGWGADEKGLFKILCQAPKEYLEKVNIEYATQYGYTLSKVLESELGGDVEHAAMYMLGMKLKPMETVAALIKKACAGFGTNELLLTKCLIRYQPIMKHVNQSHMEMYEKSVEDRVQEETGGDFQKILLQVVATGMGL